MRKLGLFLAHLPLLLALAITAVFSLDVEAFRLLKKEESFGWWLVVLIPAAILLFLLQIAIWSRLLLRRKEGRR